MTRPSPRKPLDFDRQVSAKLFEIRVNAGVSQKKMAAALGLSFQQMQKYERAETRISCGRLQEIAQFLNVPITDFFANPGKPDDARPEEKRALLELTRAFWALKTQAARLAVMAVVKAMAGEEKEQAAIDKGATDNLINCTTTTDIEHHD
jgi:transcriptional regulator with XRE-family HTH domain